MPTISLYEVFKRVLHQRDEGQALRAAAVMQQGTLADFTAAIALRAAKLSAETRLPMADSVMLATARAYNALLWTQGADFEGMEGIRSAMSQPQDGLPRGQLDAYASLMHTDTYENHPQH